MTIQVSFVLKFALLNILLRKISHNVPSTTQFGTIVNEVKAARELVLCCWLPEGYDLNQ